MNERHIAPAFIVAVLCAFGFMVTYGFDGNTQLQGGLLGGAFGGLGVGMILWAKHLMPNEEVEDHRHEMESSPEEQQEFNELIEGAAGDVTRRKFLSRLGLAAVGSIGLAALFPLKSLGPNPGNSLFRTGWAKGLRLVTQEGKPIKATDLEVGGALTVFPDNGEHRNERDSTIVVKVDASAIKPRRGRESWAPEGNIAYSKVCTHVGCPVGLYRENTQELLCPCHQSTFDVLDGARPIFGPASRSLPQLPLSIDSEGYLIAQSDYKEPVGPGFWSRGRRKMEDD